MQQFEKMLKRLPGLVVTECPLHNINENYPFANSLGNKSNHIMNIGDHLQLLPINQSINQPKL